ncbi:unnamed protein product [Parajaminaea phylloscopi]
MARITSIPDQGDDISSRKQGEGAKKPPPPASYLIHIVPALTVAVACYANWRGLQATPHNTVGKLLESSPKSLRAQTGLPLDFGSSLDSILPHPVDKLPYVVLVLFRQVAESKLGLGLVATLASITIPWYTAALIEGLKPGNASHPSLLSFFIISLVGQSLMIGFALPAFYVPILAYKGWKQATNAPRTIRPLPSPPQDQVLLVLFVVLLSGLPIVLLYLIPTSWPRLFFLNAMTLPFPPLAWLPLFGVVGTKAYTASHRGEPRLAASNVHKLVAYGTMPLWWLGLFLSAPSLRRIWQLGTGFPDDGASLMFWDNVGLLFGAYAVVLVQAEIDFRAVQCGGQRVHRARLFIEDVVFGSAGTLLLGPGFGFAMFFARREVLAEKARFGIEPDFAASGTGGTANAKGVSTKGNKET